MNVFNELADFYNAFNGQKGSIGLSVQNIPIYYFCIEKTSFPKIIVQYSIHAREYVTTYLALRHIEDFNSYGKVGTVYFIPMLNPDGVKICLDSNPLYKANANGVDLNVNFDANWGSGALNKLTAGSSDYIGTHPFSEPETLAIKRFTEDLMPNLTVSYHSKGEEIYWQFYQTGKLKKLNSEIAKHVAKVTGYTIKPTPNSAGGYKDWCVQRLRIPALTIEVGSDELTHPIEKSSLNEIYNKNKNVIFTVTEFFNGKVHETCPIRSKKGTKKR